MEYNEIHSRLRRDSITKTDSEREDRKTAKFIVETTVEFYSPKDWKFRVETTIRFQVEKA